MTAPKAPTFDEQREKYLTDYADHLAKDMAPKAELEQLRKRVKELEGALRESRIAILSPINAGSIIDTVWVSNIETLIDFIDATLTPNAEGAE